MRRALVAALLALLAAIPVALTSPASPAAAQPTDRIHVTTTRALVNPQVCEEISSFDPAAHQH